LKIICKTIETRSRITQNMYWTSVYIQAYINICIDEMLLLSLNTRNMCSVINDRHDKANLSFVQQSACEAHVQCEGICNFVCNYIGLALHLNIQSEIKLFCIRWDGYVIKTTCLTLRRRIKSHLLFAGIIRSSPFSPR